MFKNILQDTTNPAKDKLSVGVMLKQINGYLSPLLEQLDTQIDKRLVGTFFNVFSTILAFRHRNAGLLLSELGGYICGFDKAPAGTKRISNLLRSKKWQAALLRDYLFERSTQRVEQIVQAGKTPLMLWDDSRIEKNESRVSEGLCPVFSSKAARLTRIRPGFFTPPKGRICVPGFQWTGVFLSNLGGVPSVCQMSWWTTRGKFKEDPDNIIYRLLQRVHKAMGTAVVHVFDRGYANEKMLRYLFRFRQLFIIRWKININLTNEKGETKKTHLIARSLRPRSSKIVKDKERKRHKSVSMAYGTVYHPEYPEYKLTLVVIRDRHNHESPMYILTSAPLRTNKEAWRIFFSYMHRWEIEQGFRFLKSELGIESPRLWFWDNRQKLMGIVTLVYDFLLNFFRNREDTARILMRKWAHRTGKRYRNASIPLYRLRAAISACLNYAWFINSG